MMVNSNGGFSYGVHGAHVPPELINDVITRGKATDDYASTHTYTLERDGVRLALSPLGGAQQLLVTESPWVTACEGYGPSIPGAGDLDSPLPWFNPDKCRPGCNLGQNVKWAYCLPPEWVLDSEIEYLTVHRREEYPDMSPTLNDVLTHPDVIELFGKDNLVAIAKQTRASS